VSDPLRSVKQKTSGQAEPEAGGYAF